ncbi:MAG: hypothetical protein J7494_06745 [Sphingobium sp.]|nr:hypothetical protein [Sphingobium sp.]
MRATVALVTAALLLSACGKGQQAANESGDAALNYSQQVSADSLPADAVKIPMKEFMGHVMQFGGDSIWKWQGFITDSTGEHALQPKNEKEWTEAESGALTLAEITNILMLPGRRIDDPAWDKAVAGVRDVALRAAEAAKNKNYDKFFEIGGELDAACEACHVKFVPNYQAPPELKVNTPPPAK